MTTVKLALKLRSVTYPAYQSKDKNMKKKNQLQRMNSFDYSDDSNLIAREQRRRREVSLEGRSRAGIFRRSLSMSTDTTTTLSCSHRSLRHSQDICCLPSETEDTHHAHVNHHAHADRRASFITSLRSRKGSEFGQSLGNNIERLIDWRRTSPERLIFERSYSYDTMERHRRSPERRTTENSYCVRRRRLCTSTSVPPPAPKSSTEKYPPPGEAAAVITDRISNEGRRRRLHFRRALSLFSLACSSKELDTDRREEKSPQKRILRPPTRHVYRRGVSGLPIQCSSTYLGLAY